MNGDQVAMLMIWRHKTTSYQWLQISHCRLSWEYPKCALSMSIRAAQQINYPLIYPLICAPCFLETFFLVWNSKGSNSSKSFRCRSGKNWWPVSSAVFSIQGAKWIFIKCFEAHKCVLLFNQLNSVGTPLEVEFKDLQWFCRAITSILPGISSV